ncbi:Aminotransferase-like, plant mobile domain [Sesbania bispinosa]|nr:Aminotransferase-like, plant mobile domain [Sesbania bispinosa]
MVKSRGGRVEGQVEQPVQQQHDPTPAEDVPQEVVYEVVYKGGPRDTSLLRSYESHVARLLWSGEADKFEITKLDKDYVKDIVDDSGLGQLIEGTHSLVVRSLLSTFTERWHRDTSNFHLPMGEMTIILDKVFSLLHIPVHGRLTWLRSVYENNPEQNHLMYTARAYLLQLVVCTIFADKSPTVVQVHYLELFRECWRQWARLLGGAVALTYLYEQLNEASSHQTRHLAGYSTLFQAWILEHFPHITHIKRSPNYVEGMPLCRRLRPHRFVDRAPRQCGHIQSIPFSPHIQLLVPPITDVHAHFLNYHDHLLDESRRIPLITYAGECTDRHLDWFRLASHP